MGYNITFTEVTNNVSLESPSTNNITVSSQSYPITLSYNAVQLDGVPGANGADGISVTNAAITDGNLLITLSNSTVINAGTIQAPIDWGNVTITGGSINGTVIGNVSPSTAAFTDVTANTLDAATLNGGYF